MITYDEFAAACAQVAQRGHRPSYRLVGAQLGRGSHTTMREFFGRWKAAQATQPALEPSAELKALEALSPGAAARMREAFRAEVAAEMSALRQENAVQLQELQDLHDVVVDLERSREELSVRLAAAESLQRELAAIDARGDDISHQISATDARVAAIDSNVIGIHDGVGALVSDITSAITSAQVSLLDRMDALTREHLREHLKASNDVHRRQVEQLASDIREHQKTQDAQAAIAAAAIQQLAASTASRHEILAATAVAMRRDQKRDSALLQKALGGAVPRRLR